MLACTQLGKLTACVETCPYCISAVLYEVNFVPTPKTVGTVQMLVGTKCFKKLTALASAFIAREEYHVSNVCGGGWLSVFTMQN